MIAVYAMSVHKNTVASLLEDLEYLTMEEATGEQVGGASLVLELKTRTI